MISPLSDRDVIDDGQFEEMRELLAEDFKDLVLEYLEDSQGRVQALRQALIEGDNAAGFDIAHTLKGACANIGAIGLMDACHRLQQACQAQNILAQGSLIDAIENELTRVQQAIEQRLKSN